MKNSFSIATFSMLWDASSVSKKSKIWVTLSNWSSLEGEVFCCNKIPASRICRSGDIKAYQSLRTPGSIQRIIGCMLPISPSFAKRNEHNWSDFFSLLFHWVNLLKKILNFLIKYCDMDILVVILYFLLPHHDYHDRTAFHHRK